jgi:hypothetical protein
VSKAGCSVEFSENGAVLKYDESRIAEIMGDDESNRKDCAACT